MNAHSTAADFDPADDQIEPMIPVLFGYTASIPSETGSTLGAWLDLAASIGVR
jgi:hypothetical protein